MNAEQLEIAFRLATPTGEIEGSLQMPAGQRSLADLVGPAQQLTDLYSEQAIAHSRSLKQVPSCQAGCAACCRGLITISIPEALHIARLVSELESSRRRQVEQRFDHIVEELIARDMLDEVFHPEWRDEPPHIPIGVAYHKLNMACPLLEDERCSIYADRPILCRSHNVVSPAEFCQDPGTGLIDAISMPVSLSSALACLVGTLTQTVPQLIPLCMSLRWAEHNAPVAQQTWPAEELLVGMLEQIGKPAETTFPSASAALRGDA